MFETALLITTILAALSVSIGGFLTYRQKRMIKERAKAHKASLDKIIKSISLGIVGHEDLEVFSAHQVGKGHGVLLGVDLVRPVGDGDAVHVAHGTALLGSIDSIHQHRDTDRRDDADDRHYDE